MAQVKSKSKLTKEYGKKRNLDRERTLIENELTAQDFSTSLRF